MRMLQMRCGYELKLINDFLETATKQDAREWQDSTEKTVFFLEHVDLGFDAGREVPMFEQLRDAFELGMEQILTQ